MNRQNLIARLVARKLQSDRKARPICICMFGPTTSRANAASKAVCLGTAHAQK